MDLQDLKEQQKEIIAIQQRMLDLAEAENRDFTTAEDVEWRKLDRDFEKLVGKTEAIEENQNNNYVPVSCRVDGTYHSDGTFTPSIETINNTGVQKMSEYRFDEKGTSKRDAYNRYCRFGAHALSPGEFRALQVDISTSGGFLTVPLQVANEVIRALDNEVFVRKLARTFSVPHAESFGAPDLDPDFGDPEWTSELSSGSADDDMGFKRRDLTPHPVARRIKVSNKLLRMSQLNPEALVQERMVYKIGTVQENGFLNGNGVNQPLGVFTADGNGIDTDRDSSTDMTATGVKADGIISAVGALKAQYRKRAVWIAHRDFETKVRKLKDGDGQYLWRAGLDGSPGTLMGFPLHLSEYAPNTFTANQYVAILGDFHFYWIVDALNMQIQRLTELYAESNQTGFICRAESDGAPILSEAFVRLQMGS